MNETNLFLEAKNNYINRPTSRDIRFLLTCIKTCNKKNDYITVFFYRISLITLSNESNACDAVTIW